MGWGVRLVIAAGEVRPAITNGPEQGKHGRHIVQADMSPALERCSTIMPRRCPGDGPWSSADRKEWVMKISARNMLKGTVVSITKGATTAHVRLDVAGTLVTSAITNEAVDELGLVVGQSAYAVVKASDVMIAID